MLVGAAIMYRSVGEIVIFQLNIYLIPLFFAATEVYISQILATRKRGVSDTRYAVRYRHARKAAAIFECIFPDTRYAVRYRHARKAAAIVECTASDARYAVRY